MKKVILGIIGGVVLVFIIAIVATCGEEGAPSPTSTPPTSSPIEQTAPEIQVIEITAEQLYAEYDANEVAADQKYKGKKIKVTGIIDDISRDMFGGAYISFEAGDWLGGVNCTFSDAYEEYVAKLVEGQTVTVTARCKGFIAGTVSLEMK